MSGEREKPDVVAEKMGMKKVLEIESGLRNGNYTDLDLRVKSATEQTIIIVPNKAVEETYANRYKDSWVVCFYYFLASLKSEQPGLPRSDGVEEKDGVAAGEGKGGVLATG